MIMKFLKNIVEEGMWKWAGSLAKLDRCGRTVREMRISTCTTFGRKSNLLKQMSSDVLFHIASFMACYIIRLNCH